MALEPDDVPDVPTQGRPAGTDRDAVRGQRRREIIQAAFEVFAERGFRGASLDQLAQRVGLTKAGLLHYFPSKEHLLVAVLQERDRDSASVGIRNDHDADPLHGRLSGLRAVVEQNASQRGLVQAYTVLSAESVTENHPAQEFFRERYRVARRRLAAVMKASGREVSDQDAERAAALMLAVMDGLQVQWLLDPDEIDMAEAFNLFAGLVEQLGTAEA